MHDVDATATVTFQSPSQRWLRPQRPLLVLLPPCNAVAAAPRHHHISTSHPLASLFYPTWDARISEPLLGNQPAGTTHALSAARQAPHGDMLSLPTSADLVYMLHLQR
jgi:hypothetical protein